MKKLKLQLGNFRESLSREQMKQITGGYEGNGLYKWDCFEEAATESCNTVCVDNYDAWSLADACNTDTKCLAGAVKFEYLGYCR